MLIRSQNKEVLATLELLFDIEVSGGVISVRRDMSWCCLLGEYSTKAKAMKVLDMIQEAYSEYQIMLNFSVSYLHEFKEKTDGFAIFQMPEDSEVEA
jgi:hypothetical protein|nr:MAG TPA: hypothetical protein [Caudoviricetes sp.]